jgi:hypothetical protein
MQTIDIDEIPPKGDDIDAEVNVFEHFIIAFLCWVPFGFLVPYYGEPCILLIMSTMSTIFPLLSLYHLLIGCNLIEPGKFPSLIVI